MFEGKPLHYGMYAVVFLTWLVMYPYRRGGCRVSDRVASIPHAAETLGINVITIRYQAVILGGFIAGMAGAWFSMEAQSGLRGQHDQRRRLHRPRGDDLRQVDTVGRLRRCLLFGFARALGSRLQFLNVEVSDFEIPSEFFRACRSS